MYERKLGKRLFEGAVICLGTTILLGACTTPSTNTARVTPQGTVNIDTLRAGMPEAIFKNAVITFVVDTTPGAAAGNKTQYVSRTYNAKHGQFVAQCKDDRCYELQILFKDAQMPVSREEAVAMLQQVMPPDTPAESSVNDMLIKSHIYPTPKELHYFGDKYMGMIVYGDKDATKVTEIDAFAVPPDTAETIAFGKPISAMSPKVKALAAKARGASARSAESKTDDTKGDGVNQ